MRQLVQGDNPFVTQDTGLAAVLTALDFEFFDPENPADTRVTKGKVVATWVFETKNPEGKSARDVLKVWKNPKKYVEESPHDPVVYTVCAVKNLRVFNEAVKNSKPAHGFKLGKHTLWIREDDPKFKEISKDPRAIKL